MADPQAKRVDLSANCKTISIKVVAADFTATFLNTDDIVITTSKNSTGVSITSGITVVDGVLSVSANLSAALKGVIKIVISSDTTTDAKATFHSIATCDIDCCIAKLVESGITCTCECDKCKEDLDRAEKIHLLLQASRYAAEQEDNYTDAVAKYNRAQEMCTEVCACGC